MTAQSKDSYKPSVEPCDCPVKVDSSFKSECAYLIVPENRNKKNGKTVKLPFIIVRSNNPSKKEDPILFTGGGPGNSSIGWAVGITKGELINDRDCIAFEQRGTRYAIPYLRSFELDTAIKESYRDNLNKDSMVVVGVKRYKKRLEEKGIDLSGYNTDETVSDIHDLLKILKIDSVNLMGGSYSGGLMLAVLQKDSSRIRSLVLDSPLPTFIPIDEQEPANFMEALHILFEKCKKDSAEQLYGDLKQKFHSYFMSIIGRKFFATYFDKMTTDSISVEYNKNDLLEMIVHAMQDASMIKNVPAMIVNIISGNHSALIKQRLDNIFLKNGAPDGMRISVYCADQAKYNNQQRLEELYLIYPYLKGYHINDVYPAICDCWNVPPIKASTKQPFYSAKPVLVGDGIFDPACRPLYMDLIHHYMPNSQRALFLNRSHGAFGWEEGRKIVKQFIDQPWARVMSMNPHVIVY